MRTPAGLAGELVSLNTRRLKGDLDRDEVIARAMKWTADNDPDLMTAIHEEWFGQRADASLARLKNDAAERGHLLVATGEYQSTFEEICPNFLQGVRKFGPAPTLEDGWIFHKQQCTMTGNFVQLDAEREAWLKEADEAVGDDRLVLLETAARARLRMLDGDEGENDAAAEG